MIESDVQDCFAELLELELITEQQLDAARQHPDAGKVQADAAGSGPVFAWMVARNIIPEDTLPALFAQWKSDFPIAAFQQRLAVIKVAEECLARLRHSFNHDALSVLLDESIISQEQFERAEAELPDDESFASPAALLTWMVAIGHLLSLEELQAIRHDAEAARAFPNAEQRVAIIAQTNAMLEVLQKAAYRDLKKEFWDNVFPGPRWLWVMGFAAFFGVGIWRILTPTEVPACDDPDMLKSVRRMVLGAGTGQPGSMYALTRGEEAPVAPGPTLSKPHEAGYAKAEEARGCLAGLKFGTVEIPYGYTIRPSDGKKGSYLIAGASPEIVQARYTHIDAEGKFANKAEPVGRTALETAIRDGVDKLNRNEQTTWGALAKMRERMRMRGQEPLPSANPEREREIADLEPNGRCQEVVAGTRYTCNVMLERNDPILGSFGRTAITIVTGDFTIERDRADTPWRVSEEFPAEYLAAISREPLVPIRGKAPASEATP
jgi:hypothetical protein